MLQLDIHTSQRPLLMQGNVHLAVPKVAQLEQRPAAAIQQHVVQLDVPTSEPLFIKSCIKQEKSWN